MKSKLFISQGGPTGAAVAKATGNGDMDRPDSDAPATTDDPQAEETRVRILEAAAALFRRYGYAKTTMADIARETAMSAGNVYRFFDSKADLMGQIAERWLYDLDREGAAVAEADGPAETRLCDYVALMHRLSRDRHITDRRVDELCALVIREHWPAVENHVARIRRAMAKILGDGVAEGAFAIEDVDRTAQLFCAALIKFNHPVLIAEYLTEDMEAEAVALCRLLLDGVRAR